MTCGKILDEGEKPPEEKKEREEKKGMVVEFKGKLMIGCRAWVGKDGASHSGGVLYDPETAETLNFVSDLEMKDTLAPVSGTLDISVMRGKGGAEWAIVKVLNIKKN